MRCRALTIKGTACRNKSTDTGYCKRHTPTDTPAQMSAAERRLRDETAAIIRRVESGATTTAAMRMSGYQPWQARQILTIAAGGEADVTDEGYRAACERLASALNIAIGHQEAALAARWAKLAHESGDWRAPAELLKRRNPDEWNPVEKRDMQIDADVRTEHRSEDAVLTALKQLTESDTNADD